MMKDWLDVREKLLPAIEHLNGTHTEDDIFMMLAGGHLRLWKTENSAALTEFQQYPRMKVLCVFIVGGDLKELRNIFPQMAEYAKANGCKRITGAGRAGWERVQSDWSFNCVCMYRDL